MRKLRILNLKIAFYHEPKLPSIWSQMHFPLLEQLSYIGGIDQQIHALILRHASTLQLLILHGTEFSQLSASETAFPALYHARCPRRTLQLLLTSGAPALNSFHAPPETSTGDMMAMVQGLKEKRGLEMLELELVANDFGIKLFPFIEESFPNLESLSVYCSTDRGIPFIEADLDSPVSL
jgi:hypothetical protein